MGVREGLGDLLERVEREARGEAFPVDEAVYRAAGRDPMVPIVCAGSLDAAFVSVGRDLGRDEVKAGEPQIGAGGRLVRSGFYRAVTGREPEVGDKRLAAAIEDVLLTNLVPYKPPGNKAYSKRVRERFRPFLVELLVERWSGERVITLGNEAFFWFGQYLEEGEAERFWEREDRYEAELRCGMEWGGRSKRVLLCPLPHPSPLNARWYGRFPELLAKRIAGVEKRG